MYATRTHHNCEHCGATVDACTMRVLTGEPGRCCARCSERAHPAITERTEVAERSDLRSEVPAADTAGVPMSREEEDAVVASILKRAAEDTGGPEFGDRASISAYLGLARSRGASLEEVVRAAVRGELVEVVRRPVKSTTTT